MRIYAQYLYVKLYSKQNYFPLTDSNCDDDNFADYCYTEMVDAAAAVVVFVPPIEMALAEFVSIAVVFEYLFADC